MLPRARVRAALDVRQQLLNPGDLHQLEELCAVLLLRFAASALALYVRLKLPYPRLRYAVLPAAHRRRGHVEGTRQARRGGSKLQGTGKEAFTHVSQTAGHKKTPETKGMISGVQKAASLSRFAVRV